MNQRLDSRLASPQAFNAMAHLENVVRKSGLEESLLKLVKSRASQINGCAWCLNMHTKNARALGETEQRLYLLSPGVMRSVTASVNVRRWPGPGRSPRLPRRMKFLFPCITRRAHFSEKERVDLTLAVIAINGWNRLNIAFLPPVGDYASTYAETK